MPHHHYQSENMYTKEYIYNELNFNKNNYSSLFHPSAKSNLYEYFRKDDYCIKNKGRSEDIISQNDILIFDNSGSTLMYFAIENNILFLCIISRDDYERFTYQQKKYFDILKKYHFGFYNDEHGKMSDSISSIINDNNFCMPSELSYLNSNFSKLNEILDTK